MNRPLQITLSVHSPYVKLVVVTLYTYNKKIYILIVHKRMSYIQFELTIFPNFFGKHKEKVDHMLRFALKLFAQVRILN